MLDWLSADDCQQAEALVQGKRVLELGSGTGVLALHAGEHNIRTDIADNRVVR